MPDACKHDTWGILALILLFGTGILMTVLVILTIGVVDLETGALISGATKSVR